MFETLKADYNRYYKLLPASYGRWQRFIFFLTCPGMWALLDYRYRKWAPFRPRWFRLIMMWPMFFFHIWLSVFTGIEIKTGAKIGRGLYIGHFTGIFIHSDVVMGENCSISQGVTIGLGGKDKTYGVPTVGKNVYFGAGAKVLGKFTIGDGAAVGANAVVLTSVPAGATAVGVPARIITVEEKAAKKRKGT